MRRPVLIFWLAALALGATLYFNYAGAGGGSQHTIGPTSLVGNPAQSFQAQSLSGATASLQAYQGKLVILNLWASWCPPCRAEMPDLQRLYNTYKNRNLVVVGVNQGESIQQARAFATALGIHFPILVDQAQAYGRVYAALGMPTTFIIRPDGIVARGFDGALTYDQMVAAVRPLLGKS
ncbi:MAG: TlpA family protein disulfide reductase [Candidatus Baltobacteraceae bacterium]